MRRAIHVPLKGRVLNTERSKCPSVGREELVAWTHFSRPLGALDVSLAERCCRERFGEAKVPWKPNCLIDIAKIDG